MKLTYNKACLGSKLLDELLSAGIILTEGIAPIQTDDVCTYIYVPDDRQKSMIDEIVEKHDPTPPRAPISDKERIEALEQAMLDLILGGGQDG